MALSKANLELGLRVEGRGSRLRRVFIKEKALLFPGATIDRQQAHSGPAAQAQGRRLRSVRSSSETQLAMDKQGNDASAAATAANPGQVMELVKQFDFLSIGLGGKIHCALTNRDLPLRVDAVQQHLNSKKLKKEREWWVLCTSI